MKIYIAHLVPLDQLSSGWRFVALVAMRIELMRRITPLVHQAFDQAQIRERDLITDDRELRAGFTVEIEPIEPRYDDEEPAHA